MSEITLNGLVAYDDTILNTITFPDGIDRDTAIDVILINCGELETMYPNPNILKTMFIIWSKKWERTFEKWYNALQIEYEPLENYNRIETNTTTYGRSDTHSGSDKTGNTETNSGSDVNTDNGENTTTNSVSAYNESNYSPKDKSVFNIENTNTLKHGHIVETNGTFTHGEVVTAGGKDVVENSTHGNIGVTTSQEMLKAELEIAKWNLYEQISDVFMHDFCVFCY